MTGSMYHPLLEKFTYEASMILEQMKVSNPQKEQFAKAYPNPDPKMISKRK